MSKKNNVKTVDNETTIPVTSEDQIVFVRVINNFKDSTDNQNFVSAGKNTFYRTNKSRADKLVEAGYAEYEDVDLPNTLVKELEEETKKDLVSNNENKELEEDTKKDLASNDENKELEEDEEKDSDTNNNEDPN